MSMFEIMTESTANLPDEIIEKYHLHILPLVFIVDNKEYKGYEKENPTDFSLFYQMMRDRKEIKTSLVNSESAYNMAKEILEKGKDLLYLGFSSALSSSYQAVSVALNQLQEEYPDQKIRMIDTRSAALGEGLLVKYIIDKREEGRTIDEAYEWAKNNWSHVCHEFTVDDLFFLKRGGRISMTTAVVGSALNVKPILHVDDQGRLIHVGKVRGRKKSLDALVDRMEKSVIDPAGQEVYISHGDCLEDAEYVAKQIKERLGVTKFLIRILDPVIGAHSGPGTVAVFYYGEHR